MNSKLKSMPAILILIILGLLIVCCAGIALANLISANQVQPMLKQETVKILSNNR